MLPSNHPDRPRGSEVLPVPADMEEDGSAFLTTTDAIEQDLDLSNSDQGAAQAVAAGLRDAKAANTRRAYASAWHTFCDWTILIGRQAMPAALTGRSPLPRNPDGNPLLGRGIWSVRPPRAK